MATQNGVAAGQGRGQLGGRAADVRRTDGIDVKVEPPKTDDVDVAGRMPHPAQMIVGASQKVAAPTGLIVT